jgi:hypothetical protein
MHFNMDDMNAVEINAEEVDHMITECDVAYCNTSHASFHSAFINVIP